MSTVLLPLAGLPLLWVGVIGTSLTYRALRGRAHASRIRTEPGSTSTAAALLLYAGWTLVATASLIWLLKEWRIPAADVGFTARFSAFDFVVGVTGAVVGLGMWPLAERLAMLGARANVLLRVPADSRRPARGAPLQMSAAAARDAWVVACVGGAVVPSLEEFLFRGYALAALQQHTESALAAMLLVSAAFASVHIVFGARVVVYGFIVSLALSVVVLWRASLYPAMLMHGLINLTAFVVIPLTARRDARGGHTDI